jgi:hypothetical protein
VVCLERVEDRGGWRPAPRREGPKLLSNGASWNCGGRCVARGRPTRVAETEMLPDLGGLGGRGGVSGGKAEVGQEPSEEGLGGERQVDNRGKDRARPKGDVSDCECI